MSSNQFANEPIRSGRPGSGAVYAHPNSKCHCSMIRTDTTNAADCCERSLLGPCAHARLATLWRQPVPDHSAGAKMESVLVYLRQCCDLCRVPLWVLPSRAELWQGRFSSMDKILWSVVDWLINPVRSWLLINMDSMSLKFHKREVFTPMWRDRKTKSMYVCFQKLTSYHKPEAKQ